MREKSQMHFKEAKEEAMRLRESADNISPDDEEDDDEKIAPTVRTNDISTSVSLSPFLSPLSLAAFKENKIPCYFHGEF